MAERIAQGWTLYRDIFPSHTSSVLFQLAAVSRLLNNPGYHVYLSIHLIVVAACAAGLFFILRRRGATVPSALLLAGYMWLSILLAEGTSLTSEPYSIFWLIAACWLLARPHGAGFQSVWPSLLIGLAFIARQYAAACLAALCCVQLLVLDLPFGRRLRAAAVTCAGFTAIVFTYYFLIRMEAQAGGARVAADTFATWYIWWPGSIANHFYNLLVLQPYVLILPAFTRGSFKGREPFDCFAAIAFIFSLGSGFVRQYPHYLIMSIPFSTLLLAAYLRKRGAGIPVSSRGFLLFCFLFAITLGTLEGWDVRRNDVRGRQMESAASIARHLPRGSRALVVGNPAWNYLLGLYPASPEVGYNFHEHLPAAVIADALNSVPAVLVNYDDTLYVSVFLSKLKLTAVELETSLRKRLTPIVPAGLPAIQIWSQPSTGAQG